MPSLSFGNFFLDTGSVTWRDAHHGLDHWRGRLSVGAAFCEWFLTLLVIAFTLTFVSEFQNLKIQKPKISFVTNSSYVTRDDHQQCDECRHCATAAVLLSKDSDDDSAQVSSNLCRHQQNNKRQQSSQQSSQQHFCLNKSSQRDILGLQCCETTTSFIVDTSLSDENDVTVDESERQKCCTTTFEVWWTYFVAIQKMQKKFLV